MGSATLDGNKQEQALTLFQRNFREVGHVDKTNIRQWTLIAITGNTSDRVPGAALVDAEDTAILHALAVHEDYRRQGIASKLVEKVCGEIH